MGGKSKEVTVGYKYFLGMHTILCEAPIDAVTEIAAADRTFWAGRKASGRIAVSRPELFGGKSREGGVGGYIDVEDGGATQTANDYLASNLSGLVPAFRGVVGLVFRRFYFGNNPYFQPLRVKVEAIQQTFGQWLPALAPIGAELNFEKVAVCISVDQSSSMGILPRQATLQAALTQVIEALPESPSIAVRIQAWADSVLSSEEVFGVDAAAKASLQSYVDRLVPFGGTDFTAAVSNVATFFANADSQISLPGTGFVDFEGAATGAGTIGEATTGDALRRIFVVVTDGLAGNAETAAATLAAIPRIETLGVNIVLTDTSETEILDAVAGDGIVPVVSASNPDALAAAIQAGFTSFVDLNGVHILRDILVHPAHGGQGDAALVGDSFATAAQQAFDEGMGFSFRWRSRGDVDGFRQLVERHLDAVTWFDEITGKYEIKLIRPDYTVGTLTTFGSGGVPVVEWFEPEQPDPRELPNQVVVTYTRRDNGEPGAVTATNVAAVVASGRVVSHKVTYEGCTRPTLAAKLAERDLLAKSQPIVKGGFRAVYLPAGLNLGSAIIVAEPRLGLSSMVVRITEIEEPDGLDNSVIVRFAQDVWATDLELDAVIEDDAGAQPDTTTASAPNVTFAEELPYFELVRQLGQSDVDESLVADEGLGLWAATADQPNSYHQVGAVVRNDSATWIEVAAANLMPSWVLTSALSSAADATTFTALVNNREGEIAVGDIIQIDAEMMRIDSIAIADGVATFTVGRGVLDTVPRIHGLGSRAFVWQGYAQGDAVEYSEGETVTVKVLPRTASSVASLADVESTVITFASRASRPYPVGNLQMDGSYAPTGARTGTITGTWAHRDRTLQTYTALDDHADGSIGPEDGVSYIAVTREVYLRDDVFAGSATDWFGTADFFLDDVRGTEVEEAISPAQATTWDFDLSEPSPPWGADMMRLEFGVKTVRGVSNELENWQTPFVMVEPLLGPIGLTAVQLDASSAGSGGSGGSP